MKSKFLDKNCIVYLKDGTIISGVIDDWINNKEENAILIGSSYINNNDINKIYFKCPNCGEKLVDIARGMPPYETFELAEKKEVFLGGCEILLDVEQASYYCYNCGKGFYRNLEECTEEAYI